MTIYVSELPKDCEECPCCNKDVDYGSCCNLGAYEYDDYFCINKKHPRCPLQSLADYTKQVRKEVVQEIWKEFEQRLMNKTKDMPVINVAHLINSVLDKI